MSSKEVIEKVFEKLSLKLEKVYTKEGSIFIRCNKLKDIDIEDISVVEEITAHLAGMSLILDNIWVQNSKIFMQCSKPKVSSIVETIAEPEKEDEGVTFIDPIDRNAPSIGEGLDFLAKIFGGIHMDKDAYSSINASIDILNQLGMPSVVIKALEKVAKELSNEFEKQDKEISDLKIQVDQYQNEFTRLTDKCNHLVEENERFKTENAELTLKIHMIKDFIENNVLLPK